MAFSEHTVELITNLLGFKSCATVLVYINQIDQFSISIEIENLKTEKLKTNRQTENI